MEQLWAVQHPGWLASRYLGVAWNGGAASPPPPTHTHATYVL